MVLKGLEHLTYKERLRELEAVQPQEKTVSVAFIIVYKYLMGVEKEPDIPQWYPVKEAAVRTHQNEKLTLRVVNTGMDYPGLIL